MDTVNLLMGRGQQTQGKCTPCRRRYVWKGRPLLRRALCPSCRRPLDRTTHILKKFATVVETPLEVAS